MSAVVAGVHYVLVSFSCGIAESGQTSALIVLGFPLGLVTGQVHERRPPGPRVIRASVGREAPSQRPILLAARVFIGVIVVVRIVVGSVVNVCSDGGGVSTVSCDTVSWWSP